MARKRSLPTPKFGASVTNLIASEDNPTRTGYFVRSGYRTGRMNNGPWWEITNGRGRWWRVDPEPGRFTHILGDKPHLIVDRSTELPIAGAPTEPAPTPRADWSNSWAELTGYVQQAADDHIQLDPARMGEYMAELKRQALAPVRDWMNATFAGTALAHSEPAEPQMPPSRASLDAVRAPFTRDQVAALNDWQERTDVHPFTCANRNDGRHKGEGKLLAYPAGWVCPSCDYTQDWAHAFMASRAALAGPADDTTREAQP